VSVIHQKCGTVFFIGNGIIFCGLYKRNIFYAKLKTEGGAFIFFYNARYGYGRFLRKAVGQIKNFFSYVAFKNDALNNARTVAQL
jgi:hypothetical protein